MLFNSFEFLVFLPLTFAIYWVLNKNFKIQNLYIVIASYFFYGMWDWKFLFLIFFTSLSSFISGYAIEKAKCNSHKKIALWTNIILNLGILGVFKYFNFFSENLQILFSQFGYQLDWFTVDVLLPVGISFYTFQAISYSIDVYRGNVKATSNLIAFLAFVSFFPQLVAGPIERASNLLPQFLKKRSFNYTNAVDGMRQMLWGFFKKLVIADNCAYIANAIFANYSSANSWTLILGSVFFAFQIYGDFSGYSDIAIGCARLFGISLNRNFNNPYFSLDIADFWRRWHISLNSFFRDYVYIPLGGSRISRHRTIFNVMIVFLLSGLWHGANWTFVLWGAYFALLFIPHTLLKPKHKHDSDNIIRHSYVTNLLKRLSTFIFVVVGWIIFRSDSVTDAWRYFSGIFNKSILDYPNFANFDIYNILFLSSSFFIILLLCVEWKQRNKTHALELSSVNSCVVRWGIYLSIILIMCVFAGAQAQFVYFQF